MKKRKVCFVNTVPTWGGGENWQMETMLAFKEKFEVISISYPKGELQEKIKSEIQVYSFKSGSLSFLNPFKMYQLYLLLRRISPDAIMFNTSSDFKMFTMPAYWAKIKHIVYRRDNGKPINPHFFNKYLLQRGITTFLPCSDFIRKSALFKNKNLIPAHKIAVVYNSISIKKWDLEKEDVLMEKGTFYFGCIGRFSTEKGQLFLPEIARQLKDENKKFKILLAGKGALESELKQKIKETNTEDCFQFLGFVRHSKDFMETIDCLLIPSHWEGLPTVAIEAMASSKPVVAFDVAGNPEVVKNGETGFVVPPFELDKFAEAMITILNDTEKRNQMGLFGRTLAEEKFSREITDKQLEAFL